MNITFLGNFEDNLASTELVHFDSIPMQESDPVCGFHFCGMSRQLADQCNSW